MKIELTIKTDYLPAWGVYEGIRELVQNGQDAKVEFDASFEVRHRKDTSTLVIENEGCTLPHEALLFGHTSKSERSDLIGKFGEGLKLGVLALVRAGHEVKIRSGSEVWTPKIERSEKFVADVLVFYIDKGREPKNRVQVEIGGITADDWHAMDGHFLFLTKLPAASVVKAASGSLLLGEKFRGRVYVKGIFVQRADLSFGYDLYDATVDRDRKMVDSYDLQYKTQAIWRAALGSRPDLIGNFLGLLESEAADVQGIDEWRSRDFSDEVKEQAAEHFIKRHGADALPVSTLADSAEVEHYGKRGIVCPKPLRTILEQRLGTISDNKQKLAKETVKAYGWHELSPDERASLRRAVDLVGAVAPLTMGDVDVVDFRDEKLMGLWRGAEARVQVAKKHLVDSAVTLEIVVHEAAHKMGGGDGEKTHVTHIEKIWSGIVQKIAAAGEPKGG